MCISEKKRLKSSDKKNKRKRKRNFWVPRQRGAHSHPTNSCSHIHDENFHILYARIVVRCSNGNECYNNQKRRRRAKKRRRNRNMQK